MEWDQNEEELNSLRSNHEWPGTIRMSQTTATWRLNPTPTRFIFLPPRSLEHNKLYGQGRLLLIPESADDIRRKGSDSL